MSILDLQTDQQPLEVQALQARMIQIQNELLEKTPQLPDALVTIHKMLIEQEDLVHLLDNEDIKALHKAHEMHKQFAIVNKEVKKVGKNKKLSQADLDSI